MIKIIKKEFAWASPLKPLILSKVTAIALHHMEHLSAGMDEIHRWHLGNGWKGFAYNYWIDFNGNIYECRGLNKGGGLYEPHNEYTISIGFQGHYDITKEMPKAQYNSGVELIKYLKQTIPTINLIAGHKHWQPEKSCPGKYFPLEKMIQDSKEINMTEKVKDFQRRYDLLVDGKIGSQTKGKAKEVKELMEYILNYQKPSTPPPPTFTHYKKDGADVFEIEPLSLKHIWLKDGKSQTPSSLVKQYPNFVNAMFFDGGSESIYRLFIENGKIISNFMDWDQWSEKGTFIIYKNGHCEVKTIGKSNIHTLDIANIHMAIQGFNCDYEANGSTNLKDSMRKEGLGQSNDYIYSLVNNRPGIGYDPVKKKVIVCIKNTDAKGLRTFMRSLGCIQYGNSCCLGLDSGGSTACAVDGKILYNTTRKLVSILTF